MNFQPSSTPRRTAALAAVTLLLGLAACGTDSLLAPNTTSTPPAPASPHPNVVVTSNYSTFDTRAEFNAGGVVDHLDGFDEFTGDLVYPQPTPWPRQGVTYTSGVNIVLDPAIGMGVQSNSLAAEFGSPLTGQFAADDAITLFGADLTLIGDKVPVGLVVSTNLGNYAFAALDIPLATSGRTFFGIALSQTGEYLTGFRFTVSGSGTALLLDNVAVGHVATVRNANPVASVSGPYEGLEGSAVTLTMSATDADNDALTYSWDLGDGTKGSGAAPPSSHTYADNGAYNIMLAVDDGRGGVDTARTTATIANVAPSVAPISLPTTPFALVAGGVNVPISTNYTDPGTLDTHTATLDCGTGVTVQSDAPNGTASGSCTFTSPGFYNVQLTVRDNDGGSMTVSATGQVVIYDASAGWVTGGGWISSPAGAVAAAPALTGKLSFNLSARYESGSPAPQGTADFKLSTGKVDFHGTAFDWLLMSGGSAQLRGIGTMNGVPGFGFLMIANDAGSDAVRIRIWCIADGRIVYDSRPGAPVSAADVTPLGGGSIVFH